MDRLEIDPDQFDGAGQGFAGDAEQLLSIWQSFRDTVSAAAAEGAGGDEIGGIIGEIHAAIVEAFDETMNSLAEEMTEAGVDVQEWAAAHREADQAAMTEFTRLAGELGA